MHFLPYKNPEQVAERLCNKVTHLLVIVMAGANDFNMFLSTLIQHQIIATQNANLVVIASYFINTLDLLEKKNRAI